MIHIHVHRDGSDENSGRPSDPLRTIEEAAYRASLVPDGASTIHVDPGALRNETARVLTLQ